MKRLALIILALALTGCTRMSFDPKTGRVEYWQCLQNKTVQVETANAKVTYSSDNTPIIVLGEKLGSIAKAVK